MTSDDGRRIDAEVWAIVVVLILGTLLVILDTTIVNIALDPLEHDLHTTLSTIQWVVTGYLLAIAAVVPLTGWLTRRFGAKRVYMTSLVMFTVGSALCGLATSAGQLIAFRVVQGLGGAAIGSVGQLILVRAAGPARLPRVMSAYGVPTILAPVFGPTVGGVLLTDAGWRWIFFVNLPIGIAAIVAGIRKLPSDVPHEAAGRIDTLGLALVTAGLVGLTYGLSQVGIYGPSSVRVLVPVVVGIALLVAFVLRTLHVRWPLLDMQLYRNKIFAGASVTTFCLGGALVGNSILFPLYFQGVRHQDALHAGMLVGPRGIGATLGTWLSGRMMERLGTGMAAAIGATGILVFTLPYVFIGANTSFVYIGILMTVQGVAIGMSVMPAMTSAYRALRPDQLNDATPQQNILQRIGSSIGAAILIAVLTQGLAHAGGSATAQAHAFGITFAWLVGLSAVATAAAFFLVAVERRHSAANDVELPAEIVVSETTALAVEPT